MNYYRLEDVEEAIRLLETATSGLAVYLDPASDRAYYIARHAHCRRTGRWPIESGPRSLRNTAKWLREQVAKP